VQKDAYVHRHTYIHAHNHTHTQSLGSPSTRRYVSFSENRALFGAKAASKATRLGAKNPVKSIRNLTQQSAQETEENGSSNAGTGLFNEDVYISAPGSPGLVSQNNDPKTYNDNVAGVSFPGGNSTSGSGKASGGDSPGLPSGGLRDSPPEGSPVGESVVGNISLGGGAMWPLTNMTYETVNASFQSPGYNHNGWWMPGGGTRRASKVGNRRLEKKLSRLRESILGENLSRIRENARDRSTSAVSRMVQVVHTIVNPNRNAKRQAPNSASGSDMDSNGHVGGSSGRRHSHARTRAIVATDMFAQYPSSNIRHTHEYSPFQASPTRRSASDFVEFEELVYAPGDVLDFVVFILDDFAQEVVWQNDQQVFGSCVRAYTFICTCTCFGCFGRRRLCRDAQRIAGIYCLQTSMYMRAHASIYIRAHAPYACAHASIYMQIHTHSKSRSKSEVVKS
jgi:hypothetical protein